MNNEINDKLLFNIQKFLTLLLETEFRPLTFVLGLVDSDDEAVCTQVAIDTMYRLFVCGLFQPGHLPGYSYINHKEETDAYLQVLMRNNPLSSDVNIFYHWHVWEICGTPLSNALVAEHRIEEDDEHILNPTFAQALTDLFEAHGVGLDIYPLVLPQAS